MLAPKPQENHACEYQDHESTMPCEHQDRSITPLCPVRITAVLHDVMSVVMPLRTIWLAGHYRLKQVISPPGVLFTMLHSGFQVIIISLVQRER